MGDKRQKTGKRKRKTRDGRSKISVNDQQLTD